jgi:hypothetical protein
MKTKYEWYHQKTIAFSYFGTPVKITYEHTRPSEYLILLHYNDQLLKELGLSNPFTLILPVGLEYYL